MWSIGRANKRGSGKMKVLVAESCPTLCDPTDCSLPDSSVHGILQAKNTGVGCHARLQGIFPTQGSNLRLKSPALTAGFFATEPPGYAQIIILKYKRIIHVCESLKS